MNKKDINTLLEQIGLSPAEAVVYMAMLDGAGSAAEIVRATSEKRPTVYYALNSLLKRGLVSKTGKEYGSLFQVDTIDKLQELVQKQIRDQEVLLEKTKSLQSFYPKNKETKKTLVSYFDSLDAIKSAIFYSLYAKDKTIRSIVPGNNFFHEMGLSFIEEYVAEKKKRKIKTIALWEDIPKKDVIREYYSDGKVRQLPLLMHNSFETTMFIYDDKTLYISPKKEQYAVLIQSVAHAHMMRAMFDNVWASSLEVSS